MPGPSPRVSIGLPVYNGERYLEVAIRSLLDQTFGDFELVICDNASTDRTEEICRAFAAQDGRIRYHRNPSNLGAARNFNLTFELSSGEYFRWASYDDLCAPTCLERCVEVLDKDPSIVMCYPRTVIIDEEDREVARREEGLALLDSDPVKRHRAFHRRFRRTWLCNPVFGLMRRDVLAKTGLLGAYNSADVILLARIALLGRIYEVPEYLFFRRLHSQTSVRANPSAQSLAEWFDPRNRGRIVLPLWKVFREHLRIIRDRSLALGDASLTPFGRARCYSHMMVWLLRYAPWLTRDLVRATMSIMARVIRRSSDSAIAPG